MGIQDLSPEQKVKTAVHEIGHILGFVHPRSQLLVPGTMAANKPEAVDAVVVSNYPSVMWPGCVEDSMIVGHPSQDDVKTMLYLESHGPSPKVNCETPDGWCIAL